MNTIMKESGLNQFVTWWRRVDGWLAPVAMIALLWVGVLIGSAMEGRSLSARHAFEIQQLTQKFTTQLNDKQQEVDEKTALVADKDARLRALQNGQMKTQEETSDALKAVTEAVKSFAESTKISAKSKADAGPATGSKAGSK